MSAASTRVRSSAFAALLFAASSAARAQDCPALRVRTAPPGLAGAYVRSVTVRTDAPIQLPIAGERLSSLRRTTETRVISRQLLFKAGDRVDSAGVAETLRRLRDQRIYSDVVLGVSRCAGGDTVDLTITTRDAWTLRPIARIVPPSTISVGVEDRNLLGTARLASVTSDQTARGGGGSVAYTDPFLFGADVIGAMRFSDVAGTHVLRASVRHHEMSILDEWRAEVSVGRTTFGDSRAFERTLSSGWVVADVGHRVGSGTDAVTIPYIGAEVDSGAVIEARAGDPVPAFHSRRFIGFDLGLTHRAAAFDTVSWFVPNPSFLDVPIGYETDLLIAPGSDRGQHAAAARYDAWLGRIWIPSRGRIITGDVWSSGYLGNVRANHIDRLAVSDYNAAWDGFWGGRLMFEQLLLLDPDLRTATLANISADPSFAAVPSAFRLADRAMFGSLERAYHLVPFGRASMIDLGPFVAASLRWDAPNTQTQSFGVAMVGIRGRVISANGLVNSIRVDVAFPVLANTSVVQRPLLSVSLGALFDIARQRDGRRRQQ